MDELKRCPFCGEDAKNDRFAPNMVFCPDGLSGADNESKKCYNDAILSIEDWNTRPIEDELRAEIERLRNALGDMMQLIGEHGSTTIKAHATRIRSVFTVLKGGE